LTSFDPAPFCAAPIPNQKRSLSIAVPSSALLCGGHTMLTPTVNLPTRRTPSPQIRARDTSLDGASNGSAGVDSAPNVDAGANGAPDLGGQRCGDHEDHGDSTNYRKLAEHNLSLPWAQITELPLGRVYQLVRVSEDDLILEPLTGQLPPWQRRTNVWRKATNLWDNAKRLRTRAVVCLTRGLPPRSRSAAPSAYHRVGGGSLGPGLNCSESGKQPSSPGHLSFVAGPSKRPANPRPQALSRSDRMAAAHERIGSTA
jgi:hypothetical protein